MAYVQLTLAFKFQYDNTLSLYPNLDIYHYPDLNSNMIIL